MRSMVSMSLHGVSAFRAPGGARLVVMDGSARTALHGAGVVAIQSCFFFSKKRKSIWYFAADMMSFAAAQMFSHYP